MAYVHNKLGGNVCASSKQATMFIYKSDDTLAVIATAGYFLEANGSPSIPPLLPTTAGNKDNILYQNDIILISAIDGFGVGKVLANTADIELVLSEV